MGSTTALSAASASAAPKASIWDPFKSLRITVQPDQLTIFDICTICNVSTPDPQCKPQITDTECNGALTKNVGTVHSLPGNTVIFDIVYDPAIERKLEFFLQDNKNASKYTPLADYRNPTNPVPGPFFPQDKGHIGGPFSVEVPLNIAIGTNYAFIYRYYFPNNNFTVYNQSTISYLNVDTTPSGWIIPSPPTIGPIPTVTISGIGNSPINNLPSSNNTPADAVGQTVWVATILSLVLVALVLSVGGFLLGRFTKRRRANDALRIGQEMSSMPPMSRFVTSDMGNAAAGFGGFAETDAKRNSGLSNMPMRNLDAEEDMNSDDEVVVFQRSLERSSLGHVRSKSPTSVTSRGSGGSSGSQPHSILKKKDQVERETVQAVIYDQVLMSHQQKQAGGPMKETAVRITLAAAKKMVSFKEEGDTAIVNFSAPRMVSGDTDGIFENSDVSVIPKSSDAISDFNDGEVERAIRKGKKVEVDSRESAESEYDSELDDNDDWRKEALD